ncbi:hypothetical protein HELRODRAFT_179887 [Helobdella robusta]|uniref:Uncharacterized protein n=1 Tax=Helobdella robusta TaxID=6412 RepID=T1FF82_HELRO|nr:hypothetical protein HELRODRAFT_179887 [Helobdella robusta]ESN95029.1 hypothetical protein HELRODRAFT_179887 [Helobdella robusta]
MKNQVEQSFKEAMLSKELEDIKLKIKESDQKIKQLRNSNSKIKEYIYQLQLENEEYLTYSSNKEPGNGKTNNGGPGKMMILSSGDHYKNEVGLLKKENDLIMEKHSQDLSCLQNLLTEKDKECKKISRQLESLDNVKALKKELSTKCEQLEQDLKLLKVSNAEEIDSLKVKLAMDSKELKETCSTTINGVSKHIDQRRYSCTDRIQIPTDPNLRLSTFNVRVMGWTDGLYICMHCRWYP